MKHVIYAVPLALLLGGASLAQTESGSDAATTATDAVTGTSTTTDATTGASTGAAGEKFGMNWPLSIGTTFFSGADSTTLRSADEITSGWQSLSPEDQAMVRADCLAFMAAHGSASGAATDGTAGSADATASTGAATTGDASTTASGSTATDTGTGTSADASAGTSTDASNTTGTGTAADATADASTGTDAATTAPAGYEMAEMQAICTSVEGL